MLREIFRRTCLLLVAAFLLAVTAQSRAQSNSTPAQDADTAYQAKDWAKAAKLYDDLAKTEPKNRRNWYRLGMALQSSGQHQKAVAAFEKAIEAGLPAPLGQYNIACVFATMNQKEKAWEYLEKAVQGGFSQPEQLRTDPDLASLRGDSRFEKLLDHTKRNEKPCVYGPEYRQFDFWVGEWDVVTTSGGAPAGNSKIELILGDCVILENWSSLGSPFAGKSYNIYNPNLKRWEQFWVANAGTTIHFYGGLKDGVMDYWTDEIPQPDGTKLKRHLQFFPLGPGKVRQFSQGSADGGKTWTVEYDFTYTQKK